MISKKLRGERSSVHKRDISQICGECTQHVRSMTHGALLRALKRAIHTSLLLCTAYSSTSSYILMSTLAKPTTHAQVRRSNAPYPPPSPLLHCFSFLQSSPPPPPLPPFPPRLPPPLQPPPLAPRRLG